MTDKFFTTTTCDRCSASLEGKSRKMSWFTEECLCDFCVKKEQEYKEVLESKGFNIHNLEGCGYMPKTEGEN